MDAIRSNVVQGIFVGVSSGIVLAIVIGGWNAWLVHEERQDQINFLALLIENYRTVILEASDVELMVDGSIVIVHRDVARKTYLNAFHKDVEEVLRGRSSRLSFDEIYQVRLVFLHLEYQPEAVPTDEGYEDLFDQLEALEWLDITPLDRRY